MAGHQVHQVGETIPEGRILQRKGTEVATIAPEASIKRAADWLRAKNVGALVVTSNDVILGIVSERDIVRALAQYGEL
jgi:CBS domain-containing protein